MTRTTADAEAAILKEKWFYEFNLPSGRKSTCRVPPDVRPIHDTRAELIMAALGPRFEGRWHTTRCADLACHEGFYSLMLAKLGCEHVFGVDARQIHLDRAALIRDAFGLENWSFGCHDLQTVAAESIGSFDIVLLLGLLYHLENPNRVLRLASEVTEEVCVIETQVVPHLTGPTDWGSYRYRKEIVGCFGIVDEEGDLEKGNPEANISSISLVPSLEGLLWILRKVGFGRVEVVPAREHHYEQHRSGKRVVVAAFKE